MRNDDLNQTTVERDTSDSSTRRRMLFALLGGAGATVWHRPIVESILLPAHAQTSPAVSSSTAGSSSGGTASSSGSASPTGSSGGSSGSGIDTDPKLTMIPPSYTSDFLSGGACVENCDATEMLIIVDVYDADGTLSGSYQDAAAVESSCVAVHVSSETFGFSEWPENYMFVIAIAVPDCQLEDSSSGFFTGIKDLDPKEV